MVNFPSVMGAERQCDGGGGGRGGSSENTWLVELCLCCWRSVEMLAVVLMHVREVGERLSSSQDLADRSLSNSNDIVL